MDRKMHKQGDHFQKFMVWEEIKSAYTRVRGMAQ